MPENLIHSTAVIHETAVIAEDVSIGPFCIVGENSRIGRGTKLISHVVIGANTIIGEDNTFYQFASIGEVPQDKKFKADDFTELHIGDRNTFREYVSVNRGTVQDASLTKIGDDNWIMATCHIAHDCIVGSRTIFANGASLAGHVTIEDDVILGGYSMVYQRCRVGTGAITGFSSGIHRDVPPFITAAGYRAEPAGINSEGLRRHNYSSDAILATKRAYKILYRQNLMLQDAIDEIKVLAKEFPHLQQMVDFLEVPTQRGIVR
ncbi:acyl-[acyl-carrier-protein]--UDP-N-acetylglucosamine O-acyltransferase [Wohlfahrtiimonas chitiniclastica]|uniref:Acyl-[acyl-carrier-protein]--UDP-N-acetylglucosamine O-acyltransferase n=1 Tax=Wohlfahrtiimonas chitiniclastica SH04 TaxID=1261130 RepID=L8Y0P2_9GAMM|nr:acyl-ACP--UDP-N-acetylglucosamine O-acyltransferase [Wohlfahrtiimonas chitiniclastica]ELV08634.1 Acyl-[acyl-carrier-protein]--UDP-N-acetylglucosamine O-acyltransferase [Wohlfahrtiimonas chitiniclastica SH04]MBS7816367.1 acyl-ACP--UDP-N-acetylglucosamine O-acyltransferase [Wohlfahrtiimonas chitiniclastica]MBS7821638.1 acyl-ACP--UDP-N-acetylglucosamine O-acyltransferase [Wohlfahrtiimonas chitiniclastica]MBS7827910.1 acyl-ACP--UDP-N-acetylglucosamine O-acyltransferase [Wohlfahrtiimonas chitinic